MDPLTPLDTLCRIILRAREYEAQTASDYDRGEDPDNVDDEQEGALSVLEDEINDSVEEELIAAFEDRQRAFLLVIDIVRVFVAIVIACGLRLIFASPQDDPAERVERSQRVHCHLIFMLAQREQP